MENLGKTNGSEPVSVEVVSKVDEILSDFFGKLDKAVTGTQNIISGPVNQPRCGSCILNRL